jgi:hypothetical protein
VTKVSLTTKNVQDIEDMASILVEGCGTVLLDWQQGQLKNIRINTGKKTSK